MNFRRNFQENKKKRGIKIEIAMLLLKKFVEGISVDSSLPWEFLNKFSRELIGVIMREFCSPRPRRNPRIFFLGFRDKVSRKTFDELEGISSATTREVITIIGISETVLGGSCKSFPGNSFECPYEGFP